MVVVLVVVGAAAVAAAVAGIVVAAQLGVGIGAGAGSGVVAVVAVAASALAVSAVVLQWDPTVKHVGISIRTQRQGSSQLFYITKPCNAAPRRVSQFEARQG